MLINFYSLMEQELSKIKQSSSFHLSAVIVTTAKKSNILFGNKKLVPCLVMPNNYNSSVKAIPAWKMF